MSQSLVIIDEQTSNDEKSDRSDPFQFYRRSATQLSPKNFLGLPIGWKEREYDHEEQESYIFLDKLKTLELNY
jgi:hypothetical protein